MCRILQITQENYSRFSGNCLNSFIAGLSACLLAGEPSHSSWSYGSPIGQENYPYLGGCILDNIRVGFFTYYLADKNSFSGWGTGSN